jgi:hypothetical protein
MNLSLHMGISIDVTMRTSIRKARPALPGHIVLAWCFGAHDQAVLLLADEAIDRSNERLAHRARDGRGSERLSSPHLHD